MPFGTECRSVGIELAGLGVAAHVAHDVAVLLATVVHADDGVLEAVAGLDDRCVSLFAHQGSHDAAFEAIAVNRAVLHKAVAQLSLAGQSSGQTAHTLRHAGSGHLAVLKAEVLDDTADGVEESYRFTQEVFDILIGADNLQILDDMATTVVVALEAFEAGSDGKEQRVLHVDVGRLAYIEVAALHRTDAQHEVLQVLRRRYLIRVVLDASA